MHAGRHGAHSSLRRRDWTTQWQEEFQDKFGVTFEIFGRDFWAVNPASGT